MAINAANIRLAIEELLEGTIGSVRTVTAGVMSGAVFDGQPDAASKALSLSYRHRFDVELTGFSDNEASPIGSSLSNRRLINLEVSIPIVSRLQSSVQESLRSTVLANVVSDADTAIQALHYAIGSGALATTNAGGATTIIGGMLAGPNGIGSPTWTLEAQDWDAQEVRSRIDARAIVRVTQATS